MVSPTFRTRVSPIDSTSIAEAAEYLRSGEIVAFPTETVYGLAAIFTMESAIKKIFAAKERPSDNPLIVHISDLEQLAMLTDYVHHRATIVIDKFWPGPLTILFEKLGNVSPLVTAGLNTVAVRMPKNIDALRLIRAVGLPLVAPSANRSGTPSPTSAQHVFRDLSGRLPLILDGGRCSVGIESTVIDVRGDRVTILRPGAVTKSQLESVLEEEVNFADHSKDQPLQVPSSPGLKYQHYAPSAEIVICSVSAEALEFSQKLGDDCRILSSSEVENSIWRKLTEASYYSELRSADDDGIKTIIVVVDGAIGEGLRDRIERSAARGATTSD